MNEQALSKMKFLVQFYNPIEGWIVLGIFGNKGVATDFAMGRSNQFPEFRYMLAPIAKPDIQEFIAGKLITNGS